MAEDRKKASDKAKDIQMENKQKALEAALAQIEKNYGKGAVMRLGENVGMNVDCIPTGSMTLDAALGIGGLPRGRIVEIYGPEASGKTTLALHAVAEAQKMGGEAAFIDVEHALDPVYAQALGVDVDSLLVSQPDTGEQRSRSRKRSSARAPSILSWWTRSPPWCPVPRSRVRWGTAMSACRPG